MLPSPCRAVLGLLCCLPFLTPPAARAGPPPPASAAQTPDTPGAVWEGAAPGNFQPSRRPSAALPIDRIVIHDIEGTAGEAIRWFQNPQARVSSHYVVDGRTGRITQMVRERDIAWHAGDHVTNLRSIGIEHGGFAYRPGFFGPREYEASARLVRAIALRYGIPRDRTHIIGHFEVPDTPRPGHFGGRNGHTDPGPYWDWDYFMVLVRDDAALASSDASPAPVVLHPGEAGAVTFALSNAGDDVWPADLSAASDAALRDAGPVYLGRWEAGAGVGADSAFSGPDWVSPRFAVSPAGGDTAPGAAGRFVVMLHAPPALGPISETFRLFKVPVAPRSPVPFGPALTVSARVVPWDIRADPPSAPPGWGAKTLPDGSRALWCKTAARGPGPPGPVRWQAVLPVAGRWDVSVRWASGPGRSARAAYQVGGAANVETVLMDQRRGGGQWHRLGRFRFGGPPVAPDGRPGAPVPAPEPVIGPVTLLSGGSETGVVVAGGVRFVGPFP